MRIVRVNPVAGPATPLGPGLTFGRCGAGITGCAGVSGFEGPESVGF